MKRPTLFIYPLLLVSALLPLHSLSGWEKAGFVESIRGGGLVVVVLPSRPVSPLFLRDDDRIVADLAVVDILETGGRDIRVLCRVAMREGFSLRMVTAGTEVVISRRVEKYERDLTGRAPEPEPRYRTQIVTPVDGRTMRLVAEGKFHMGAAGGEADETPLHIEYRDNFYMDVCEVSNDDYLRYVRAANVPFPSSWKGKVNPDGGFTSPLFGQLPVLVTYAQAEAYARWAGKRLPTEIEWEKAARGLLGPDSDREPRFPWGTRFSSSMANCGDFWDDGGNRRMAVERYGVSEPGLLPVTALEGGASPWGMLNMAGNAPEWTRDWYRAYKGSGSRDRRYGTQYKVVRGGGWWSPPSMIRVSSREAGGTPALSRDNSAGFRCVRDVNVLDREREP